MSNLDSNTNPSPFPKGYFQTPTTFTRPIPPHARYEMLVQALVDTDASLKQVREAPDSEAEDLANSLCQTIFKRYLTSYSTGYVDRGYTIRGKRGKKRNTYKSADLLDDGLIEVMMSRATTSKGELKLIREKLEAKRKLWVDDLYNFLWELYWLRNTCNFKDDEIRKLRSLNEKLKDEIDTLKGKME
jgi:hypothetical protein